MTDKAMMIIHGSGRVVTITYHVASELDCNAIITALGDQETGVPRSVCQVSPTRRQRRPFELQTERVRFFHM
jgi:hypothetical protein